jgi:hypothetical protein
MLEQLTFLTNNMATSLSLENDSSLAQGYIKVNGSTAATLTTSGITGNLIGNVTGDVTGNVTGSLTSGGSLTLATEQAASGTSVDFTGIPSWAKRITVMFKGVSTNGSSPVMVRLGTASGIVTSGYLGSANEQSFTDGFTDAITGGSPLLRHGMHIITLIESSSWVSTVAMGASGISAPSNIIGGFSVNISGTLDKLRVTTQNGTDTFDAGIINISFEG